MNRQADYRDRIARLNSGINAFLDLTPADGTTGLCYGVKSNIAVEGLPWTAGFAAMKSDIATEDAECVKRIRQSGGTVLGTLNMHEGALGATTDNKAYGRTFNPWKPGYTPGGSSGGSGAAAAAGLCDVALGSDTMGSVRIPAAYCGAQGHKPSAGVVPDHGIIPLSTSYDHVGPLARRVEVLWDSLHVLTGWGAAPAFQPADLSQLKIGIWRGEGAVELSPAIAKSFANACEIITRHARSTTQIAPPGYEYGRSRRAGLLVCEVEANAAHKDRIASDPEGFSKEFRQLLAWGAKQSADQVDGAYAVLRNIREKAQAVFDEVDFVIAPTAPQTAFPFSDAVPANQADFTAWANFAALPATAVFAGMDAPSGLPTSLQVIGREGADRETLRVAGALEALFGEPPLPPGFA